MRSRTPGDSATIGRLDHGHGVPPACSTKSRGLANRHSWPRRPIPRLMFVRATSAATRWSGAYTPAVRHMPATCKKGGDRATLALSGDRLPATRTGVGVGPMGPLGKPNGDLRAFGRDP